MAEVVHVDNLEFKGYKFRASDFLSGPNVQSNQLDPSYEDFLKQKGVIPVSTQVFIPTHPSVTVDWTCEGWFSVFEIAFRVGFTLPCSGLMRDVVRSLGVMPFQLMPSVWKLVYSVDSLCKKHHLVITIQDLMNCYHVRTVGKGRVCFRAIKGDEALITNLDSGDDKNWSCRFLFINLASLGEGFEFIPDRLAARRKSSLPCIVLTGVFIMLINDSCVAVATEWVSNIDDESLARLTAFRNVGSSERAWPKALCRPLILQFDPVKIKTKIVVSPVKGVEMMDREKVESSGKGDGSASVPAVQEAILCVKSVRSRTRGSKMSRVDEELLTLKKKLKVETIGSKDVPIEIPAAADQDVRMADTPVLAPTPSATPTATPVAHSPDTLRLRRAMKALCIRQSERDFCEASSSDRSDEISESMANLDDEDMLNREHEWLESRSILASFQALHFSTAASRDRKLMKSEEANAKAALQKSTEALENEMVVHANTLVELSTTKSELQMAKDALKALDAKMLKMLDDHDKELKDTAVQYTLMARINMLLEPEDQRASWDVQEEIGAFKLKFPNSDLEEWGVPDVVGSPAATK